MLNKSLLPAMEAEKGKEKAEAVKAKEKDEADPTNHHRPTTQDKWAGPKDFQRKSC